MLKYKIGDRVKIRVNKSLWLTQNNAIAFSKEILNASKFPDVEIFEIVGCNPNSLYSYAIPLGDKYLNWYGNFTKLKLAQYGMGMDQINNRYFTIAESVIIGLVKVQCPLC